MAEELFVPCTPRVLPPEKSVEAAATAVEQNPGNRPASEALGFVGMLLSPDHLAVLTTRYWGVKGVELSVGFMENTPNSLASRILSHFNAWGEFCNVTFRLTNSDAQVRVTRTQDGYWSYLGTDILHIPRNQPTMCLQGFTSQTPESEFRRVVRHEVGHTLGFPHEHMRRQIIEQIDQAKAIAYFRQTQGWSPAVVQQQVLTPLDELSIMGSPTADETSIMCYSLPGSIMRDGQPVVGGKDFTDSDRAFAAKIYPKAVVEPPPPPPPGGDAGDLDLSMDFARKAVSISLPSGWTVTKKPRTAGETMSVEREEHAELYELADRLEGHLPLAAPAEGAAAGLGGLFSKLSKLVADVRGGNWVAALGSIRDVLDEILGPRGDDGTIQFTQRAAALPNVNWVTLVGILGKLVERLLPLVLA